MANKAFSKFLAASYKGVDGVTSALEEDVHSVNRCLNYESAVSDSLRGRVGCQTSGAHGFFAIFPYRYTRTQDQYDILYQVAAGAYPTQTAGLATTKTVADGATIEKLIGINHQVWVLDTMNVTVTYGSGSNLFVWHTYVNGSNINFKLTQGGSSILDTSLGSGVLTEVSIYSLLGTIDALATLSVSRTTRGTCPPFAIINGDQTSAAAGVVVTYGTTYTWTVANTPHNFTAGDVITWRNSTTGRLQGGIVISVTATTITYVGPEGTTTNNQILGYLGQPATNFPIANSQAITSGNITLSFPYWRLIPEGDSVFGRIYKYASDTWVVAKTLSFEESGWSPATSENSVGNLYIAASTTLFTPLSYDGFESKLVRLDGLQLTRAGLPTPTMTVVDGGVGAVPAGTYKYKAFLRRYDAQGNIWDGPVSAVTSITQVINRFTTVTVTPPLYSGSTGFQGRSCYKHTTEAPATGAAFYVDDSTAGVGNTAFIQPGDVICLTDNTAQTTGVATVVGLGTVLGTLHNTRCTAYSAQAATISPTISSIRVADSSGYQINADTPISTGLTVVVLRTAVGGNQYYKLAEFPCNGYAAYPIYDNTLDAVLTTKEQYIEVEIGKEHNAPPPCSLVCQHQGGLAVARGPLTPNQVSFSTAEGLEYFPTASNSFDVPSTQSGPISAIASDTNDRLAVFKDRAYYDVVGDLDGGTFSVNIRNEGDFGITSQASLARVKDTLVGLSRNGFVTIKDGFLDGDAFTNLNAKLVNWPYYFSWAVAVNDSYQRTYICSIPTSSSGNPVGYAIDYSRPTTRTFERDYGSLVSQGGGMAIVENVLYQLSDFYQNNVYYCNVSRRLARAITNTNFTDGRDSFLDNTAAINYVLEFSPISLGEPNQLKTPIRIVVYSLPNDYVKDDWVEFALSISTAASSVSAYIGTDPGSNITLTFTDAGFSQLANSSLSATLKGCKTYFYIVQFTTNTVRQSPFITGYEIEFSENYTKEDLRTKP